MSCFMGETSSKNQLGLAIETLLCQRYLEHTLNEKEKKQDLAEAIRLVSFSSLFLFGFVSERKTYPRCPC